PSQANLSRFAPICCTMNIARPISLSVTAETWPIAGSFTISRGAKTQAVVVVVTLADGVYRGRGECVPYARYGETVEGVIAAIEARRPAIAGGLDRIGLQQAMPPGAARNAIDCAFWDIEAKRAGKPAYALAALTAPKPLITAFTISLGEPASMARATEKEAARPLLKIKLGDDGDPARIAAVRAAAPKAGLIVDANEGWTATNLTENLAACADAGVALVEQPLPAGHDDPLAGMRRPVLVCADESAHDRASLAGLGTRYDAVNIKLDKA